MQVKTGALIIRIGFPLKGSLKGSFVGFYSKRASGWLRDSSAFWVFLCISSSSRSRTRDGSCDSSRRPPVMLVAKAAIEVVAVVATVQGLGEVDRFVPGYLKPL